MCVAGKVTVEKGFLLFSGSTATAMIPVA